MFLQSSYLGIDLRADSIKVAYLVKRGKKSKVKDLYETENPVGKVVFENQRDQDTIKKSLYKIKQKYPFSSVIMGIPSNFAVFRYVKFPFLNKRELNEAIFWEMQEFNTVFNNDYISDYEILDEKNNIYRVLLVAIPKELAMAYSNILNGAGFYIKALDVYPLAYARVLKSQNKIGVFAIIDLNGAHNEITIVENGKLVLNRNLDFSQNSTPEQVTKEVSKIFNFYFLQSKSNQVDEIILIGKDWELNDIFKNHFDINVHIEDEAKWDLFSENIKTTNRPINFISAIGFALRG